MEFREPSRSNVAGVGRAGFIRDPSGLLMSVIRTLASSDDSRKRQQEKQRLEEAFAESDEKLDELVAKNYEELARTIKQFGKIGERIADSRTRIKQVKESLLQCKSLLHCRQDELQKLWVQGLEHKKALQLLDAIEEVKAAPENIERFMKQKRYLHGTQLIIRILNSLNSDLIKVEALNDIRNELMSRKVHMHENFISELHKQIYFNSSSSDISDSLKIFNFEDLENFVEDLDGDPEKDPFKLMTTLVLCIGLLQKIPDALEATKVKMDRHINMIITHSTIEISDLYYKQSHKDDPKRLLKLLEKLFKKFRCIARAHEHVLYLFAHPVNQPKDSAVEYQLYDMEEVWSKIQSVLQLLLQEYLDYENSAAISQHTSFEGGNSLASHFSRKRATRPRMAKLFRFEGSSHAISMNTYLREQRAEQRINSGNPEATNSHDFVDHNVTAQKVCRPNSRNITYIFGPLNGFIEEIEKTMRYTGDRKCLLNDFINDYIQNVFIRQMQYEMKRSFDAASKVTDPLRALTDVSDNKELNSPCSALLQSAIVVDKCMWELQTLMTNLGGYHDQFLAMASSLLSEYKVTLTQSYSGVVQPAEDQHMISASWARDHGVTGFLRSLENWKLMGRDLSRSDLQKKYSKQLLKDFHNEAQYFVSRLGNDLIPETRYVHDIHDLVAIANLHESLEWFANRLELLISQINPSAPEDTVLNLKQLHRDYSGLSQLCLICLHIEIRVHCFVHLMEMCKSCSYDIRSSDNMERDNQVVTLSFFIMELEKLFQPVLQPHKMRYMLEGLGHTISAILITGAKFIPRINQHGIKKMCRNIFSIQQSVTHATMSRESHLDSARLFYEMLYHYPDDLQNIVVEQGVQFEENEYIIGIELLHRSRPGSGTDSAKQARIQRLREIISEQTHKSELAERKAQKEQQEDDL